MKTLTGLLLILLSVIDISLDRALAQTPDLDSVRFADQALAFSSGVIEKTSPIDGTVNLITGDNQSSGNRMLLGKRDSLYLKLNNPAEVTVGDLFTIYRRVRKVFHPVTRDYLGFVVIRSAIVRVTAADHALSTAEVEVNYGPISPGDPVVRFAVPTPDTDASSVTNISDLEGMIIELQADRPMTLVSQSNVVYLDRGREDGLKTGDILDIQRRSAGLPPRKIGQLKVLSVQPHIAVAKVLKANTRVMKGDRFKFVGSSESTPQPVVTLTHASSAQTSPTIPADLVTSQLKMQDASGQSRLNLGDLAKFLRYESGDAAIKPESYTVLDQFIAYLRTSGDTRLIRVEGHTDNVEIGPSLKSRYPSNAELSKVRANGVLRYLVEKGGVNTARIAAVALGDTKPTATNDNEEGRMKNRRVEILLYAPENDAQAPKPEVQTDVQKLESNPSSLSAGGGGNEQPTSSTPGSETGSSAGQGTLSMSESSQVSAKDGSGSANSPEGTGAPSRETSYKQDAPQPQQAGGTPTE